MKTAISEDVQHLHLHTFIITFTVTFLSQNTVLLKAIFLHGVHLTFATTIRTYLHLFHRTLSY